MLKHTLLLPFFMIGALLQAQTTVVDVVVNSEVHTTLEAAVIAAELADDLSGEGPFTVFAPTDAAFEALPAGTVDALLADPTIYRFQEALAVYGPALKELIHEEFGDGIMSAINFKVDIARREHPDGDRVVVTFDGKFLDYRW